MRKPCFIFYGNVPVNLQLAQGNNGMDIIENKVAASGLITLDLEQFLPDKNLIAAFDLKSFLFRELILREKDYRNALKTFDWSIYQGKNTAVFCSVDAIIPVWAYMLAASYLQPVAASVYMGTAEELEKQYVLSAISEFNIQPFMKERVIIKGCGDRPVPEAAYLAITAKLMPVVRSVMYGEACSTVPVYKAPAAKPE